MKSDIRFVNELIRIVNGALRLDIDKVRNYTSFLANKLDEAGESSTAERLRKVLQDADHELRPTDLRSTRAVPVDTESRFPLLEKVKTHLPEPPVQLLQAQWDVVNEFVSVAKSHALFVDDAHAGALSLVMYGPPGTGKSRLARHIAGELGMDLYVARLDGLISSFLGSTAKNIRALFDFASRTPCILFLDEFDAIAKVRIDAQEMGELKRVVNSFLQNLDSLGSQTIVIAATNHEQLLDAAVWRRFTYRLELLRPDVEARKTMWADFSLPAVFSPKHLEALSDLSEGFSGSDIREAATRLRRKALVEKTKDIALKDAFSVLVNLALRGGEHPPFAAQLNHQSSASVVQLLRERDARLYSLSLLAELLGHSKPTIHRLAKVAEDVDE